MDITFCIVFFIKTCCCYHLIVATDISFFDLLKLLLIVTFVSVQPETKRRLSTRSPSPKKGRTTREKSPKKVTEKLPPVKRGRAKRQLETSPEKQIPSSPKKARASKAKDTIPPTSSGQDKVIHRRLRKRNVPTRDFGQSP